MGQRRRYQLKRKRAERRRLKEEESLNKKEIKKNGETN